MAALKSPQIVRNPPSDGGLVDIQPDDSSLILLPEQLAKIVAEIKAIHQEVKARYGSPRAHAELVARGHSCCVNTVAKLMSSAGVAAKTRRKFRCTTASNHDHPVAENVVDRQFEPESPNRVWTADITYIPTREGWLYLPAVEDLYSRQVVGWAMGDRIDGRPAV